MKEDSNENKHRENREKALWLATKTMHIARQQGMLRHFIRIWYHTAFIAGLLSGEIVTECS